MAEVYSRSSRHKALSQPPAEHDFPYPQSASPSPAVSLSHTLTQTHRVEPCFRHVHLAGECLKGETTAELEAGGSVMSVAYMRSLVHSGSAGDPRSGTRAA